MLHSYTYRYDYIPDFYRDIKEATEVIDAQAEAGLTAYEAIQDVLNQFFVETATWGLASWERISGLPTDPTKPLPERRSLIISRLRGFGTATPELIENVAESWYGGDVEVIESPETYTVTVKFVSSYGVPSNMVDVERALREIIPAHLLLKFEFKYNTFDALTATGATFDDITNSGLTFDDLLTADLGGL